MTEVLICSDSGIFDLRLEFHYFCKKFINNLGGKKRFDRYGIKKRRRHSIID